MLIGYEIKKLCGQKAVVFGIVFVLLFNVINILKYHYHKDESYDIYMQTYRELKGQDAQSCREILQNKIEETMEENNKDAMRFVAAYEMALVNVDTVLQCEETSRQLYEKSMKMAEKFKDKNTGIYILNKKLAEAFRERKISQFKNVEKYQELIEYHFSDFLILLLLLLGVPGMFGMEQECNVYETIKTTRRGYRDFAWTKIGVAWLYSVFLCVLMSLSNYICFWICYQFDGILQPVYAISNYSSGIVLSTPFRESILSLLIRSMMFKILGFGIISMMILAISLFCRQVKFTWMVSLSAIAGMIYVRTYKSIGLGKILNLGNPVHYLLGEKMYLYFDTIQTDTTVFLSANVAFMLAAAWIVILCLFILGKYCGVSFVKRIVRGNYV